METDFYIEIISDELKEGMLILSDPMGRNIGASPTGMMGMMGGGGMGGDVVVVDSGGPSGSSRSGYAVQSN
jgi:hypothetical protein